MNHYLQEIHALVKRTPQERGVLESLEVLDKYIAHLQRHEEAILMLWPQDKAYFPEQSAQDMRDMIATHLKGEGDE